MSLLKPCPFCGLEPSVGVRCLVNQEPFIPKLSYAEQIYNQKMEWFIECEKCEHRIMSDVSMDECIQQWNRSAEQ